MAAQPSRDSALNDDAPPPRLRPVTPSAEPVDPTAPAAPPAAEPQPAPSGDPALLEDRGAVQVALDRVAAGRAAPTVQSKRRPKLWLAVYVAVLAALVWALPLIGTGVFAIPQAYVEPARRVALVVLIAAVIQVLVTGAELTVIGRIKDAADRYNLLKVLNLASWVVVAAFGLTQLFASWYTAAASLGLVSLVLGLALQAPLTSFFAWIYILIRQPYRVGDRIQIGDATGDVIQVSYLDTTLWEFGGRYLSTDHPSGRIIKFPNANVLNEPVYNYTWPLFPYRWDEIKFQVGYDSDLEFVARTMQQVVEEELGEVMLERVTAYRTLLAQTPVDELNVQERPAVLFRVSENTWLEAIVRYVVDPRQAGRIKTRLIAKLLEQLNAAPDRVRFPKGDAR